MMQEGWKEVSLGEIFDFKSGLSKSKKDFGFGYTFLTFKDVFNNFFVPEQLTSLANTSEQERHSCSIKRGDVFLTRTSETQDELGMSCVALKDYHDATFNGFTKRLRPKSPDVILPEYAAFYFRSSKFRKEITTFSSLSTRASLNNDILNRLTISLPDIETQKKIGDFLKVLTDKIELNRQTNQTLEAMAQALFTSWFVDFEPFGGVMPSDWEVSVVANEVALKGGGTPSTKKGEFWENGTIHWTTPKDLSKSQDKVLFRTERKITERGLQSISSGLLPCETVLMSSRAPVGYLALAKIPVAINQGYIAMLCNNRITPEYMLQWCSASMDAIKQRASGTTFLEISKSNFKKMTIVVPSPNMMGKYTALVGELYEKILCNSNESKKLTDLRDTLLPKLMRGEINVSD